ncbi:MAG: RluA family pseudouridine synthase [Candidatus Latescibacterota bacterium]
MDEHNRQIFIVAAEDGGQRLDSYLASRLNDLSRTRIQKLNKDGHILVDGMARPSSYAVRADDEIELYDPSAGEEEFKLIPQDIPLDITYEDADIIVVNKAAGLVVHPAHGNWDGTLVNALLGRGCRLSKLGSPFRPGIVHRLDKDTSGLMVVAKNDEAYVHLSEQILQREFTKLYHAFAWGNVGTKEFTVDAPIGRHPIQRQKMTVPDSGGREALTKFFVIDSFRHFDYIRITAFTGRTHQIRVHLSHVQHPIVGDPVYGGRKRRPVDRNARTKQTLDKILTILRRHALHASTLAFEHPTSGDWMEFRTALPDDMLRVLELLYLEDWFKEAGE